MITLGTPKQFSKQNEMLDLIFNGTSNSLRELVNLLNNDQEVSSIWFCGNRIEHNRCLGSEEIGWGIAVLPNSFDQFKMPQYHPHQAEIIIPICGTVRIDTYHMEGGLKQIEIQRGRQDYQVIERVICHRVKKPENGYREAAFFYLKTNIAASPQGIGVRDLQTPEAGCRDCEYHGDDPRQCPMFQSFLEDLKNIDNDLDSFPANLTM